MTKKSKTIALLGTLAIAVVAFLLLNSQFGLTGGFGRVVDGLIARNVEARGGVDAWRAVDSLRVAGRMDLGQGMNVPYTIEQKRPGKMCLEFEFDGEVATQCVAGDSGWKVLPYLGRTRPEPMTDIEFREMADTADIDGLLIDAAVVDGKVLPSEQAFLEKVAAAVQLTNEELDELIADRLMHGPSV